MHDEMRSGEKRVLCMAEAPEMFPIATDFMRAADRGAQDVLLMVVPLCKGDRVAKGHHHEYAQMQDVEIEYIQERKCFHTHVCME